MRNTRVILVTMLAVIGLLTVPAPAEIVLQYLLDENPITKGVTAAADTTGNHDGLYDGTMFGGDSVSVAGYTGVANTAVKFEKDEYVELYAPAESPAWPNDQNDVGGAVAQTDDWMVDMWFQLHGAISGNLFSEFLGPGDTGGQPGSGGETISFAFTSSQELMLNPIGCCAQNDPNDPNNPTQGDPPDVATMPDGGWEHDQWYYTAGVVKGALLDEDGNVIQLGSNNIYVYDPVTDQLYSESKIWEHPRYLPPHGRTHDLLRFPGNPDGIAATLDNLTAYNVAWDPSSYLAQQLGVPEPSSLACLVLGGLALLRRRSCSNRPRFNP